MQQAAMQRDTKAWQLQVWISFLVAAFLCGVGLAYLPGTVTRSVSVFRVSISCGSAGGFSGGVGLGTGTGGFVFWFAGLVWANAAVSAIVITSRIETVTRDAGEIIESPPHANLLNGAVMSPAFITFAQVD